MKVLFLTPPVKDYGIYGDNVIPYTQYAMYAAFLDKYAPDVESDILECPPHRIVIDQLADEINRRSPDVVVSGTLYAPQSSDILEGFQEVKGVSPDILTVAEGSHFGAIPGESLEDYSQIDFVIVGEAENTLVELVQALERGESDLSHVKGLAWRDGDRVAVNERRPLINNLEDLPRPAYHLLDLDKNLYRQFYELDHYIRLYASRGCAGRCEFCHHWPHFNGVYRTRAGHSMAEEVAWLHRTYDIRTFEFYDPDFGADPLMVENFCEGLEAYDLDIQFSCFTRADNILAWNRRGLLPRLRQIGFQLLDVGIEHYTDEQLKRMGKKLTTNHIEDAFRLARENDLATVGFAMIGWPEETEESAEALYSYVVDRVKPDVLGMQCLQPLPGTPLWRRMKDNPDLDRNYDLYDRFRPVMPTDHLTRKQLGEIYVRMLVRFYSDPAITKPMLESDKAIPRAVMSYTVDRFGKMGQRQVKSARLSDEEQ